MAKEWLSKFKSAEIEGIVEHKVPEVDMYALRTSVIVDKQEMEEYTEETIE